MTPDGPAGAPEDASAGSVDEQDRRRVLDEIVATERSFVSSLRTVIELYIEPLKALGEDVEPIFANWESLVRTVDHRRWL
jgi:hypothetical protein